MYSKFEFPVVLLFFCLETIFQLFYYLLWAFKKKKFSGLDDVTTL